MEQEQEYADGLRTSTTVHLDWLDRLRILWHGRLDVTTATKTEHVIGRHAHDWTHLFVPRILPQRTVGYAEAASDV